MKLILLMCLSVVSLFTYTSAHAQAYPCSGAGNGEVVVGQTSASNGIASVPLCQHAGDSDASSSPSQPQFHWQSRWGAIATDEPHGILGASTNMKSQRAAEKAAMDDCKTKGGSPCKLAEPYMNSCIALTVSDSYSYVGSDPQLRKLVQEGMETCTNAGAKNCHTYYTACSPPVLVR